MASEDIIRMRNEWKRTQLQTQVQAARIHDLEREQARQRLEQDRLIREQLRIIAEQTRQAEQLAQDEADLRKLYFRIEQAEDIIAHHTEMLEVLNSQRDAIVAEIKSISEKITIAEDELDVYKASTNEQFSGRDGATLYMDKFAIAKEQQSRCKKASADVDKLRKQKTSLEGKLMSLTSKIFSTEQKIKKAEYDKYETERKMA